MEQMEQERPIPRRAQLEQLTPAELSIRNVMLEIEQLGADIRLTEAIIRLQQALTKVGDFVDGVY